MLRSLKLTLFIFLFMALWGARPILAQDEQSAQITSPQSGQTLFGSVPITGTATHPQFQRYKVEFTSEETSTPEWLLIAEVTQQVTNGPLAQWNTTLLPDGRYQLRLRVILRDGTVLQTVVTSLVISNKIPTALPTALQPATPLPPTDAPTEGPSPTPLILQPPTNTPRPLLPTPTATFAPITPAEDPAPPLVVAFDALRGAFCTGTYCSLGIFVFLGVYSFFRARLRPYLGRGSRRE
ncbi:MAG: hypothetical protein KF716_15495 [Anaerolineae bacterium]|nr:hypothetical protein [Anaerolineae bacterium]